MLSINAQAANQQHESAPIRVAVAANFSAPAKQLVAAYQHLSSDEVVLSFGSSGKIYAQILRGAPFDIFLSADQHKPAELEKRNIVQPDSRYTYAVGALVLWSKDVTLIKDNIDISQLNFEKLAIANPRIAPYGHAALQVLASLNADSDVENKLVFGENIAQTFAFVQTGNAQLGLIALSQYLQLDKHNQGSGWQIPASLHDPIRQDAVLLKKASKAASLFYQFLKSEQARQIIADYGYQMAVDSDVPVASIRSANQYKYQNSLQS